MSHNSLYVTLFVAFCPVRRQKMASHPPKSAYATTVPKIIISGSLTAVKRLSLEIWKKMSILGLSFVIEGFHSKIGAFAAVFGGFWAGGFQKAQKGDIIKSEGIMNTALQKKQSENASPNRGKSGLLQSLRVKSRLFPPLSLIAWTRRIYGKYTCLARTLMGSRKNPAILIFVW